MLYILVTGDHIGYIFHVINIGINILIHLLHDILGVDSRIFKIELRVYLMETPVMTSTALKSSTVTTAKIALWILLNFPMIFAANRISLIYVSPLHILLVCSRSFLKEIPK